MTKKESFSIEIIRFYKAFVDGSSNAIKILADIQENYPNEYNDLIELHDNPQLIENILGKYTPEEKDAILLVIIKASSIGRKTQRLFECSPEEKRKLIKELEEFGTFVETKIAALKKQLIRFEQAVRFDAYDRLMEIIRVDIKKREKEIMELKEEIKDMKNIILERNERDGMR